MENLQPKQNVKVTLELCAEQIQYLQELSDSRAHSVDSLQELSNGRAHSVDLDDFESEYRASDWDDSPYEFLFMIVDAAFAQGHLTSYTVPTVTRVWRNLDKIRGIVNKRNRKIVDKFNDYNRDDITEKELYDFKNKNPCPLVQLSEKLDVHQFSIRFELTDGHPFIKFYRDDKEVHMMDFSNSERDIMFKETKKFLDHNLQ